MARSRRRANPFYLGLIAVGVVFFVTACAYGVMSVRAMSLGRNVSLADTVSPGAGLELSAGDGSPLEMFLDQHGGWLLAVELGILAILTVATIGTDHLWSRPPATRPADSPAEPAMRS